MSASFLLKGMVIGFSIAAPVGPIGVLCIRRTLHDGRIAGLVSGLGAATADALYGCIAGFGLTWVSTVLIGQREVLGLAGGLFLLFLGVRTFLARPAETAADHEGPGLLNAYGSTLVLTLTNPLTILSFTGVFAGLGLAATDGAPGSALWLILGVFVGSTLWWCALSAGVGLVRERLQGGALLWVNRLSGSVIAGFGINQLVGLVASR
jgi:threonine/homoserine/homoserine lactone efflux protein